MKPIAVIKPAIIKFVCKGAGVTLAPPALGNIAGILTTEPGSRYCGLDAHQALANKDTDRVGA